MIDEKPSPPIQEMEKKKEEKMRRRRVRERTKDRGFTSTIPSKKAESIQMERAKNRGCTGAIHGGNFTRDLRKASGEK